jgi:hypothetical protein
MSARTVTAFRGTQLLASGEPHDVARAVWRAMKGTAEPVAAVLLFDDETGRVVDLEMRGDESDMLAHLDATVGERDAAQGASPHEGDATAVSLTPRGRGRPRLGVVAREVTLLPRHWEWLASQAGGASVALRKLVDDARRTHAADDRAQASREAAYRFMHAIAGDLVHFEEATRALYRGDAATFRAVVAVWPTDVRAYATLLAFPSDERADDGR